MDNTVTFSDVCDKLYKVQNPDYMRLKRTDQERKNYISKNLKYFKMILKVLGIETYVYLLQPQKGTGETTYYFSEKSLDFLVELLNRYTDDNMLELRRGHLENVSDGFMVWLYEGFSRVFIYRNVSDKDLSEIESILAVTTDYPQRNKRSEAIGLASTIEELVNISFRPKLRTNLGRNDNVYWLEAMKAELLLFIDKWSRIYSDMGDIRQEEINALAEEDSKNADINQEVFACLQFEYAEEIRVANENDSRLKELQEELKKLEEKKAGDCLQKQKDFQYLQERIQHHLTNNMKAVIESHYPDFDFSTINQDATIDYSKLKPS